MTSFWATQAEHLNNRLSMLGTAIVVIVILCLACNSKAKLAPVKDGGLVVIDTMVLQPPRAINYSEGDVSRRDGKVIKFTNAKWEIVETNIVLEDGTIITPNGEARGLDGKVFLVAEGSFVTKAGRFFDKTGATIEMDRKIIKEDLTNASNEVKEQVQAVENFKESTESSTSDPTKQVVKEVTH